MSSPCCPKIFPYSLCATLLSVSAALSAEPRVAGNTISWPDDGWYQVQDAVSYASLCEGGLSCEVPDGAYIVINHSSGQRYEGITVPASSGDRIVVEGNIIRWPDDGWYQVQDANTYASICEGGRSCEVLDGTYIVINHHSGQRYEGVVVPAIPLGDAGIVIDGNRISWPDDGWYQVQDATTYASLCEGGRSCEVTAGTYHVINHTSGKRHENLVVEEDPVVDPPEDPQISAANALTLLQSITDVINERAVRQFLDTTADEVTAAPETTAIFPMPQPLEDFAVYAGPDSGEPTDYVMAVPGVGQAARLFDYTCFAGGDMQSYIGDNSFHDRVFDDCVVGEATYNGTASRRMNTLRGEYPITYYFGYRRSGSDGIVAELSGEGQAQYLPAFSNENPLDHHISWNNLQFSLDSDESTSLLISNHAVKRDFEKLLDSVDGPFCQDVEIDGMILNVAAYTARDRISGQFDVRADWSDNHTLTVELDLVSLDDVYVTCDGSNDSFSGYDPYELAPWTGQIQIDAPDGSGMTVRPAADSDMNDYAFVIELDNGEQLGPVDWSGDYAIETRPWEGER